VGKESILAQGDEMRKRPGRVVLIVGVAASFVTAVAAWVASSTPIYPINRDGYAGIRVGMTRQETRSHLGVRSGYYARNGNPSLSPLDGDVDQTNWVEAWFGDEQAILVEFGDDDRVRAKALYAVTWLDERGLMADARRWLRVP
jgi:hypothetical protein